MTSPGVSEHVGPVVGEAAWIVGGLAMEAIEVARHAVATWHPDLVSNGAAGLSAEDFIQGIHDVVFRSAVEDMESLLAEPPGERPCQELVEQSAWWNGLDPTDRNMVRRVMTGAADHAVFGFLCVIDNVRRVVDRPGCEFRLMVDVDGVEQRVTDSMDLHDLFGWLRDEGPLD